MSRAAVYRGVTGNAGPWSVAVVRRFRHQVQVRFLAGPYAGRTETVHRDSITEVAERDTPNTLG